MYLQVKTNIRNRLQGDHLAACMRISINGPDLSDFPYQVPPPVTVVDVDNPLCDTVC